jgi:hypothetical protein
MLITSAGPFAGDERFRYLWGEMRRLKADIVDEHYYMAPKWFRDNVGRYDDYPRTGRRSLRANTRRKVLAVAAVPKIATTGNALSQRRRL